MEHQFWLTKKCVQQKLGTKEDPCIVSSDSELDSKLDLFRHLSETTLHLQKILHSYEERLCILSQEEHLLGRYLKESGKNEREKGAKEMLVSSGKSLGYTGHQRLSLRTSLVRLDHELDTFRNRAITDTRNTILELEKSRTLYRANLSWLKSASSQLDPDSSLNKYRKIQAQVRDSKVLFDKHMLTSLQKVDLLVAARCNLFSHSLIHYQNTLKEFHTKAAETLFLAVGMLEKGGEISLGGDGKIYFGEEYKDSVEKETDNDNLLIADLEKKPEAEPDLLDIFMDSDMPKNEETQKIDNLLPSFLLNLQSDNESTKEEESISLGEKTEEKNDKKASNVSWLSLFADLDPLANTQGSI